MIKSLQQSPRVLFFGTPEFAVPTLEALIKHTTVIGVVTQPDKPSGRTQTLTASPVKVTATDHHIPVMQPHSLKVNTTSGKEFQQWAESVKPDIAIVIAYGKIIPPELLSVPTYGFLNIHGSLLPLLRGASPIQTAIKEGFTSTGVTIMKMDAGMDTGPLLAASSVTIAPTDTSLELHNTLSSLGASLLMQTLGSYMNGSLQPQEQDHTHATYCSPIQKKDGLIDWATTDQEIERLIRAFTPWPGTYTMCDNKRVKIISATLKDGTLHIEKVQPEGRKPMPYESFLLGYPNCIMPPRKRS